jgi:ABC-type hemin transport system ATPase subunit
MVMQNGTIRALGTPEEVLRDDLLQEVFDCNSLRSGKNPFSGKPGVFFAS